MDKWKDGVEGWRHKNLGAGTPVSWAEALEDPRPPPIPRPPLQLPPGRLGPTEGGCGGAQGPGAGWEEWEGSGRWEEEVGQGRASERERRGTRAEGAAGAQPLAGTREGAGTRCRPRFAELGCAAGAEPPAQRPPGAPAAREDGLRREPGRCHRAPLLRELDPRDRVHLAHVHRLGLAAQRRRRGQRRRGGRPARG